MNEPTEIKYSLDENGEPYFAATHIKAIIGLDFENDEDLITIIFNLQNEITKIKTDQESKTIVIENLRKQVDENTEKIKELTAK